MLEITTTTTKKGKQSKSQRNKFLSLQNLFAAHGKGKGRLTIKSSRSKQSCRLLEITRNYYKLLSDFQDSRREKFINRKLISIDYLQGDKFRKVKPRR